MKEINIKKSFYAFTMMELVFVIVVVGILSAMIAPNFQGNNAREAADQIISHIRYTQHLAMMDEKYDDSNLTWYRNQWHIDFEKDGTSNKWVYSILSANNPNLYAKNPLGNTKYLTGLSSTPEKFRTKDLQIGDKYGINSITFDANCTTATTSSFKLYFDNLGRPYGDKSATTAPYQNLLKNKCTITISDGSNSKTIEIVPETGYAHITN